MLFRKGSSVAFYKSGSLLRGWLGAYGPLCQVPHRGVSAYSHKSMLRRSRAAALHSDTPPEQADGELYASSFGASASSSKDPHSEPPGKGKDGTAPASDSPPSPLRLSTRNLPRRHVRRYILPGVSEDPPDDPTKASTSTTEPTAPEPLQPNEPDTTKKEPKNDDPNVLLQEVQKRNKVIQSHLINGLGADFAKAGLHSGGVRTSFSVMNYQTVKQITGLARVPSKLLVSCLSAPDRSFDWIDISAHPTASLSEYKESIQEILLGLQMHQVMVEDSAQPMLLPQATITKTIRALLLRYAVSATTNKQTDSVQELTNRFTMFLSSERIVTVHRAQCNFVEELRADWEGFFEERAVTTPRHVLHYFVKESIHTFSTAISKCIVEFDRYEAGLFSSSRNRAHLAREIYHIKRRASVYGRTLTLTQDAYSHISSSLKVLPSHVDYQEVQHELSHVQSLADELNANADSVLQLLFQLSSYQVNELMRVLTLFSAFFIPLNFIAAVYGMNFDGLPLLSNPNGEVYCAALMLTIAVSIFIWFKKKHFL